jgi:hypothetical protein
LNLGLWVLIISSLKSIVLKPGPARRVDPGPRPTRAGLMKKRGKEKPGVTRLTRRVDPVTRQDPVKTRWQTRWLLFFFLLKRHRFDFFFKKKIDPADPVKPGDPAKTRNPGLGPGRPPGRVLKLCSKAHSFLSSLSSQTEVKVMNLSLSLSISLCFYIWVWLNVWIPVYLCSFGCLFIDYKQWKWTSMNVKIVLFIAYVHVFFVVVSGSS